MELQGHWRDGYADAQSRVPLHGADQRVSRQEKGARHRRLDAMAAANTDQDFHCAIGGTDPAGGERSADRSSSQRQEHEPGIVMLLHRNADAADVCRIVQWAIGDRAGPHSFVFLGEAVHSQSRSGGCAEHTHGQACLSSPLSLTVHFPADRELNLAVRSPSLWEPRATGSSTWAPWRISAAARAPPTAPIRTAPSSPPCWSRGLQRRCHSPAHSRSTAYSHLPTAQCPTDGLPLRPSRQLCWSSCRE